MRTNSLYGYVGFFKGKRVEVYAKSLYQAKLQVIEKLKVPRRLEPLVAVVLAEKDGKPVLVTMDN